MEKQATKNTIFDDVFRTIVQKMPQLLIPVINEFFQTHYTEDSSMVIRMIEYDFAIVLEQTLLNGRPYEMDFPNSCVLYLRHDNNTSDELELKVNLPQGGSFLYKTPLIKVQQYTRDMIFQKRLLFF